MNERRKHIKTEGETWRNIERNRNRERESSSGKKEKDIKKARVKEKE